MAFSDRLKEARINSGLTQQQLAEQIGVAKSTIAGYETGQREPDFFKIKQIIKILNINSDYLLGTDTTSKESNDLLNELFNILDQDYQQCAIQMLHNLIELQNKSKGNI